MILDVSTIQLDRFADVAENEYRAARQAAKLAVNDTARYARRESAKEMLDQVGWPRNYLGNEKDGRLRIARYATDTRLEAAIVGRFRPTSLARFVTNQQQMMANNRRGPARLQVRPGKASQIDRAFLLRLRVGKVLDDSVFNLGLAIRLKPGEQVRNKRTMVPFGGGVYLLYGPSVNQVFRSVKDDISPRVAARLEREFNRQYQRLRNG